MSMPENMVWIKLSHLDGWMGVAPGNEYNDTNVTLVYGPSPLGSPDEIPDWDECCDIYPAQIQIDEQ